MTILLKLVFTLLQVKIAVILLRDRYCPVTSGILSSIFEEIRAARPGFYHIIALEMRITTKEINKPLGHGSTQLNVGGVNDMNIKLSKSPDS